MKKILFATTALVASAGFAAADVSISGSAKAGFFNDEAAGTDGVYSSIDLTLAGSGESDGGIAFGSSIDVEGGNEYDEGDFEDDGDTNGISFGNVYVSSGGFKATFDADGVDDLSDDDNTHDVQVDYAIGDVSIGVTADMDGDNAGDAEGASEYSFKLSFSAGGISVGVSGNDLDDSMAIDASYSVSDALSLGVHLDQNGGDQETELQVNYSVGAVSIDADYNLFETADDDWDLGVTYSEGALSLSASTDEEDAWEISGSYDLGGGLSMKAGVNEEEDYYAGVAMSF